MAWPSPPIVRSSSISFSSLHGSHFAETPTGLALNIHRLDLYLNMYALILSFYDVRPNLIGSMFMQKGLETHENTECMSPNDVGMGGNSKEIDIQPSGSLNSAI